MSQEIRPEYYGGKDNAYECWKCLRAWGIKNHWVCAAIEYLCRYEKKDDPITNLKKAVTYLNSEIAYLESLQKKDIGNNAYPLPTVTPSPSQEKRE